MPEETIAPKPLSELDRLFGALFDPKPAFADIAARPRPWVPLALLILAVLGYTHTIGQHKLSRLADHVIQRDFLSMYGFCNRRA